MSDKPGMSQTQDHPIRLACIFVGKASEAANETKNGLLFEALRRRCAISDFYDAALRGPARLWNAAQTFHPRAHEWKMRFYQNIPAFRARSSRAVKALEHDRDRYDLILQIGVTFDAHWDDFPAPGVIYTDYTSALAARRPNLGRNPFTREQQWVWNKLEAQALRRASHVFTRAEYVRQSIIDDYGLPPEKITCVGAGANFDLAALRQDALDAVHRFSGEAATFLFIGKEFPRKGGDLLWQAFAKIHNSHPAARLIMVTGGPVPAGLPLDGVEVVAPTYDREFIANLYRRADIFILPSRLETWGDVLLEAMAFGLPCVGVSGEAMDEIIENGKTGFVVPPENVEALSGAIGQLIGDKSLRVGMSRAARRRVEEIFTWDHVVERMFPLMRQCAARGEKQ